MDELNLKNGAYSCPRREMVGKAHPTGSAGDVDQIPLCHFIAGRSLGDSGRDGIGDPDELSVEFQSCIRHRNSYGPSSEV